MVAFCDDYKLNVMSFNKSINVLSLYRRGRKTRSITSEEDMPQPVLADISAPAPNFQETFQNLSVVVEEKELEITKEPESYSRPEPSESSYKTQYQLLR